MSDEGTWVVLRPGPTAEDDALVGRATGWPEDPATGPSPLRWASTLMAGVNAAVGDPRWQVDPLSLRLTEAWLTVAPGPPPDPARAADPTGPAAPGSPVRVQVALRQVVALGALTGLRLHLAVRSDAGTDLAAAGVTVAGTGPGLVGGTRPGPPEGPVAPPQGPGEGETSGTEVVVGRDEVRSFSAWVRDPTPIHTDPEAARAAGLRGPIAPGMFVLGLQAAAAAAAAAGRSVGGVGARFVRPAVVGDRLALRLRPARPDPAVPRRCLLVAVAGPDGPVVRRSWADLGPRSSTVAADRLR